MVDIKSILHNIKNGITPPEDDIDPIEADARDRVTTDKYLRSLRRQYRRELEAEEKDNLKEELARRAQEREREYLWGVREETPNEKARRKKRREPQKETEFLSAWSLK